MSGQSGIALGPIIFIIAILAILAAMISAGSSSFNGSSTAEGNKTKATAMIQIGDTLRQGMDRLTMENGIAWGSWVINAANTINTVDLYSPSGGGIQPPSIALSGNAASDIWYYPQASINGLGTTSGEQLAVINVTQGVCQQINNRANGYNGVPTIDAGGSMKTNGSLGTSISANMTNTSPIYGKYVGCFQNTNTADGNLIFFYQVLYLQ